jgi:pimeloyl-ACP methyl ester carboxylesterase
MIPTKINSNLEAKLMPQVYTVSFGDMDFEVGDWPGEKGTIIGVNGILGNWEMLRSLGDVFAPEYRFVTYDERGRGNSSPGWESSMERHAEDLLELLVEMKIERPVLLGHSMGAYIAAIAAAREPSVRAVIMLDGGGRMGPAQKAGIDPIFDRIAHVFPTEEAYLAAYRAVYDAKEMAWTPNLAAYIKHDLGRLPGGGYRHKGNIAIIRNDYDSLCRFQPSEYYPEVRCPVLVVHAAGQGKPGEDIMYPVAADLFGVTDEWLSDTEKWTSDRDHLSLVLEDNPALVQVVKDFIARRG